MENQSTETLATNYVDAVRNQKAATRNLTRAFGTSIATAMRVIGQTLVDTSDEVEGILTSDEACQDLGLIFSEARKYADARQVYMEEVDLPFALDTAMHCRKVLPSNLLAGTREKLKALAMRKADEMLDKADALLDTVSEYFDALDEADYQVEEALEALNDAALGEADT